MTHAMYKPRKPKNHMREYQTSPIQLQNGLSQLQTSWVGV